MFLIYVVILSILLQLTAAFMALRLIKVTGNQWSWAFIAAAMVLQASRRGLVLMELINGQLVASSVQTSELIGLVLSALMAVGVGSIGPFFTAQARSIIQRREAEDKLKAQNEFIKHAIDSLPHPFYVINVKDHTIALANEAGFAMGDGATCYAVSHKRTEPCMAKEHPCHLEEVVRTKKPSVVEHIHHDKDGNAQNFEIHCYPIFDIDRNVVQVVEYSIDLTEINRAQVALHESEERYRTIVEYSNDMIWTLDIDGNFLFFNKRSEELTGYRLEDWRGKSFAPMIIKDDLATVVDAFKKTLAGLPQQYEASFRAKNGTIVTIEGNTAPIYSKGEIMGTVTLGRDITQRKQDEEEILKLNRIYAVISQIDQVIVRVREKDTLLSEVCRIAIEYGKFQMAWIGMIEEETRLVAPVAYSGAEDGYFSKIKPISIEDVPSGRGPTGTAIREGWHNVCDDIDKDPRMAPWKEEALKRGYRSSIALPIKHFGDVIGAFSLYASVPHFFDPDEINLLDEVTNDISFALDSIEISKKNQEAEKELEKYRFYLEEMVAERTSELERLNRIFVGRELKMVELKKRIAELENNVKGEK